MAFRDMLSLDEEPQIDLTPLIDCLFTLIIFFVLTMSFSKPVVDIVLPKSRTAEQERVTQQLPVFVKADGSYWFKGKPVTLEAIAEAATGQSNAVLNLHMDEKAPFDAFVALVDLAKTRLDGRFVISTQKGR